MLYSDSLYNSRMNWEILRMLNDGFYSKVKEIVKEVLVWILSHLKNKRFFVWWSTREKGGGREGLIEGSNPKTLALKQLLKGSLKPEWLLYQPLSATTFLNEVQNTAKKELKIVWPFRKNRFTFLIHRLEEIWQYF